METLVVLLVLGAVIWFVYYLRKQDMESDAQETTVEETPAPAPEPVKAQVVELPTDSKLKSMTKAALAEYASEALGVELNTDRTKPEMISDLKAEVSAGNVSRN